MDEYEFSNILENKKVFYFPNYCIRKRRKITDLIRPLHIPQMYTNDRK